MLLYYIIMKILFFSSDDYTEEFCNKANKKFCYQLEFNKIKLDKNSVSITSGYQIISCSANDELNEPILKSLHEKGIQCIVLRTVGYNNVDLKVAAKLGITILYVPTYSPYSVAEHAAGLILALNRKIHKAYNRVREGNFSLNGLIGFDLHGTTVGIIGTGRIGTAFAHIMHGFGCHILAYDKIQNKKCQKIGVKYVKLMELLSKSKIISLHCPLTKENFHFINANKLKIMKDDVMLINTGRGALIDTKAIIHALKTHKIGSLGLDVYEAEKNLFPYNLSDQIINDDIFSRLLTFPNVLITSHQGFLTEEAYTDIASVTLHNIDSFINKKGVMYEVKITN